MKLECSKKILLASYISAITLSAIVVCGTFKGLDVSNITTIAALAWGEVAASNIWYYKKAQRENQIKIAMNLAKKYKIDFDINNVFKD